MKGIRVFFHSFRGLTMWLTSYIDSDSIGITIFLGPEIRTAWCAGLDGSAIFFPSPHLPARQRSLVLFVSSQGRRFWKQMKSVNIISKGRTLWSWEFPGGFRAFPEHPGDFHMIGSGVTSVSFLVSSAGLTQALGILAWLLGSCLFMKFGLFMNWRRLFFLPWLCGHQVWKIQF